MGTYYVEYDYIAKSSDELTIHKGEIITDAVPSEEGWLKGKLRDKIGHFPENFVSAIQKEKAKNRTFLPNSNENKNDTIRRRPFSSSESPTKDSVLFQVRAVYTYLPLHDDEMSIKPNDIVNVIRVAEDGWYEGILDGKQGLFPSNYVTRIHDEKQKTNQSAKQQKPISGLRALVKNEAAKKSSPIKARVLYNYKATANDELSLIVDDIVTVLDKNLEDEGWWKGELNGRVGVFPDNYVEEISNTTTLKQRPHTPELTNKNSTKTKTSNEDTSQHQLKTTLTNSDDEGHLSRDHYDKTNEKFSENSRTRPSSAKRPPSSTVTKKENGLNRTIGSLDETTRLQNSDHKVEHKVHTPSPPTIQRDPGQLESPRYANRSLSLSTTLTSNGTTDIHSIAVIEQLQKDFSKMKNSFDEMKSKFTDQIQDLITELDEEKKCRANLQIELERLQKLVQKTTKTNS